MGGKPCRSRRTKTRDEQRVKTMHWIFLLTILSAVLYLMLSLLLFVRRSPGPQNRPTSLPRVAVLIAMRNEEHYIADCLTSLTAQNYPKDKYDVFILDDGSTDRSPSIARAFCARESNFHYQPVAPGVSGLFGKMNALAQGIRKTRHDIIMITDADCVVPSGWISGNVAYFSGDIGMVGHLTVLYPHGRLRPSRAERSLFAEIQALDWLFLQTLAAKNSHMGKPITILGNNFSFRRVAYDQVGGFETLGFSVTEDFALMEAIRKQTHWKVTHTLDPQTAIYSHPVPTLKAFVQQRFRWIRGGRKARPWGIFIMSLAVFTHFSFLLTIANGHQTSALWGLLGGVVLSDFGMLYPTVRKLGLRSLLTFFPLFEIFYWLYSLFFALLYFLPVKVRWKGRTFERERSS